jgi:hypothetical protein
MEPACAAAAGILCWPNESAIVAQLAARTSARRKVFIGIIRNTVTEPRRTNNVNVKPKRLILLVEHLKSDTGALLNVVVRQPDCPYLLIPSVSSERRRYIPIGFMRPDIIASNLVLLVPGAKLYHFGVLSSAMHMAWVRFV